MADFLFEDHSNEECLIFCDQEISLNVTRARWFQRSCMFTPTWGKDSTFQTAGKKTPSRGFFEKIILNKETLFFVAQNFLEYNKGSLEHSFSKRTAYPGLSIHFARPSTSWL